MPTFPPDEDYEEEDDSSPTTVATGDNNAEDNANESRNAVGLSRGQDDTLNTDTDPTTISSSSQSSDSNGANDNSQAPFTVRIPHKHAQYISSQLNYLVTKRNNSNVSIVKTVVDRQ